MHNTRNCYLRTEEDQVPAAGERLSTLQFVRGAIGRTDQSLYPESGRRLRFSALNYSRIAASKQLRHGHGPLRSLPHSSG
jgi:hypothetical protein